eukprot:Amastigsp_a343061_19.p2 type:complete len:176 gc:universal Amastigsp_a343061_19:657-130(-)
MVELGVPSPPRSLRVAPHTDFVVAAARHEPLHKRHRRVRSERALGNSGRPCKRVDAHRVRVLDLLVRPHLIVGLCQDRNRAVRRRAREHQPELVRSKRDRVHRCRVLGMLKELVPFARSLLTPHNHFLVVRARRKDVAEHRMRPSDSPHRRLVPLERCNEGPLVAGNVKDAHGAV